VRAHPWPSFGWGGTGYFSHRDKGEGFTRIPGDLGYLFGEKKPFFECAGAKMQNRRGKVGRISVNRHGKNSNFLQEEKRNSRSDVVRKEGRA